MDGGGRFREMPQANMLTEAPNADLKTAKKKLTQGHQHRQFSDDEMKEAFDTFDLDNNKFVGAAEIKHILGIYIKVIDCFSKGRGV
jgi:Ca2+-binding EF-hand superfamily protein